MAEQSVAELDLRSALRDVRALGQAHGRSVSSNSWRALGTQVISCISTETDDLLKSAFETLNAEKESVLPSEWTSFFADIRRRTQQCQRVSLLGFLETLSCPTKPIENIRSDCDGRERQQILPLPKRIKTSEQNRDLNFNSDGSPSNQIHSEREGFYLLKSLHVDPDRYAIGLDEVIVAGAEFAVICNFKFDIEWMYQRAPALLTCEKLLIVHGEASTEEQRWRTVLRKEGCEERVRFYRPTTPLYGTVHSKAIILCFPTTCRVCIHTANMIQEDWDYKTQGAYIRDFPLTATLDGLEDFGNSTARDSFKTELCRYLSHCLPSGSKDELLHIVKKYNFSAAGVDLVTSVPGTHRDGEKNYFGHARLRELLRREKFFEAPQPSTVVCQFSSLGSLQQRWLDEEFFDTLCSSRDLESRENNHDQDMTAMKLVFPTFDQVQKSNQGLLAGLSLPVRSRNLHRTHVTEKLCRWQANPTSRDRSMPHIKTYLRYPDSNPKRPYWFFLGSFNLSVAAWGRMRGGSKTKPWDRLHVLSFEMGVLFTPKAATRANHTLQGTVKLCIPSCDDTDTKATTTDRMLPKSTTLDAPSAPRDFMGQAVIVHLPIPYQIPPPPYRKDDIAWTVDIFT